MSKTIASLITLILSQFVPVEELQVVIEAIAILVIWYSRVSAGDISITGLRK
jgi:hypothetical protein